MTAEAAQRSLQLQENEGPQQDTVMMGDVGKDEAAPLIPPAPENLPPPPPPGPPPAIDRDVLGLDEEESEQARLGPMQLDSFHAAETKITSSGCRRLPGLVTLVELNISFNQRIDEWDFLKGMPQLTYLDISMNAGFEGHHAAALVNLTNLRYLNSESSVVLIRPGGLIA